MNRYIKKVYLNERKQGWQAHIALSHARTSYAWHHLSDAGLVRLMVYEDAEGYDDSFIDTWKDISEKERNKLHAQIADRINNEGVWGIVGEYKSPHTGEWINADSCWGFIGDEWRNSGYDSDIRASTIRQLTSELKARCSCCRH